jgi:hypothetical protein
VPAACRPLTIIADFGDLSEKLKVTCIYEWNEIVQYAMPDALVQHRFPTRGSDDACWEWATPSSSSSSTCPFPAKITARGGWQCNVGDPVGLNVHHTTWRIWTQCATRLRRAACEAVKMCPLLEPMLFTSATSWGLEMLSSSRNCARELWVGVSTRS